MSEKMTKLEEKKRLSPIRIGDPDSGDEYVLEFSRDSVRFAEAHGFKIEELLDYPQTNIPALFYYAFRKNHKKMSRAETDKILDELQGLTADEIARLAGLYRETNDSLIVSDDSERKNARLTVSL